MTIILVLGAAAGAILGFRQFRVWALAPLIVFAASGMVANGIVNGLDRRNIILGLLAAVACPQIGYLMSAIRLLMTPEKACPDLKGHFTNGSPEQNLFLSNYNNFARNRNYTHDHTAHVGHQLEDNPPVQPSAADCFELSLRSRS